MNKKLIIAAIILGLGFFSLIGAFALQPRGHRSSGGQDLGQSIGVINVEGVISGDSSTGTLLSSGAGSRELMKQLKEARENPDIKGVVIRINSPGGSSPASQEIGEEIDKLRKSGKKVVASMGDIAASGGYWIACKADKIMANPATMTGSIGVIMDLQNLQELYGKIGVKPITIKSGPHKDIGSTSRPLTTEEREIFQSMVDDIYEQFIDVVATGRHMKREDVKKLADGRVYTGRHAMELGLVDQMGNYYDAIELAGKMAGIDGEPQVFELGNENPWEMFFSGTRRAKSLLGVEEGLSGDEIRLLKEIIKGPMGY